MSARLRSALTSFECSQSCTPRGICSASEPPHAAAVSVAFARLAKDLDLRGVSHHQHDAPYGRDGDGSSARAYRKLFVAA